MSRSFRAVYTVHEEVPYEGMSVCAQVNDWMEGMITDCYEDLYRFKGVLAIKGWPDRFIFQASQPHIHLNEGRSATDAHLHIAEPASATSSLLAAACHRAPKD